MSKLTDKQKLFCKAYAGIDSKTRTNAAQSVISAGYSKAGAAQQGYELLKLDNIRKELDRIYLENANTIDLSPEWVKKQAYVMYERFKDTNDPLSKLFLELVGKCVGAFKTAPDIDKIDSIEPQDTQQAITRLKADLKLLEDQGKAGTGLPPIDAQDKP